MNNFDMDIHEAWIKWQESERGFSACDGESLGLDTKRTEYLQARLWLAFMDGVAVGIQAERDSIKAKIDKFLSQ